MKRTKWEKIFNVFNIAFLSILSLTVMYPFLNVLAISFNRGDDTTTNPSLIIPRQFTLENYQTALKYPAFKSALLVSISVTVLATLLHIAVITLAAYATSKRGLVFRKTIITIFLIPTFINPGIVPHFLNIRNLHLLDNYLVYILPAAFNFFNYLILRTYIEGIPAELEESAVIDGASYYRMFIKIIFPIAMPSIAAITLFFAVNKWNDWMTNLYYVQFNKKIFVIQYLLQQIMRDVQEAQNVMSQADYDMANSTAVRTITPTSIRMAALMITVAPIIAVYPFLQKYFTKGVMLGAVKG